MYRILTSITDYQDGLQTYDYKEEFLRFAEIETALWDGLGKADKPASELVPPSGSLGSPIAYHLHCPSFTTLHRHGGETADPTNPCIDLVMCNGFSRGETLIFDHYAVENVRAGSTYIPKKF